MVREPSEQEMEEAKRRGAALPKAKAVFYDRARRELVLTLADERVARWPIDLALIKSLATDDELSTVATSGPSIAIDAIDDGASVDTMLEGRYGNERWMNELRARLDPKWLQPLVLDPPGTEHTASRPADWPRFDRATLLAMHHRAIPSMYPAPDAASKYPPPTGLTSQEEIVKALRARVDRWRGFPLGKAFEASPEDPPEYQPTEAWERPLSATSMTLLQHWFRAEPHTLQSGAAFKYWPHQRRAVETFIYLYEVCGARRSEEFWRHAGATPIEPQRDPWTKLGGELATGSGKTKVMSLLIAWSTLNAIHHGQSHLGLGRQSLVVAPGLFVRDRLLLDFRPDDGAPSIFFADPVLPPAFRPLWNLKVYGPDDCPRELEPAQSALVVTNYHKLLAETEETEDDLAESKSDRQIGLLFGGKEPRKLEDISTPLLESFTSARGLFVINDEAHRVGDEPAHVRAELKAKSKQDGSTGDGTAWIRALRRLNGGAGAGRLGLQVDLSATLFEEAGFDSSTKTLFRHTVVQYPLAEAKTDGIIKNPVLERLVATRDGAKVDPIDAGAPDAFARYRVLIAAGIERWKKVREQMREEGDERKPILMLLCSDKTEAQEIASMLTFGKPDVTAKDAKEGLLPTGWRDPSGELLFLDDDGQGGKRSTVVQVHIGEKENQNEQEWAKTRRLVHFIDRDEVPLEERGPDGRPLLEKNPYNVVVSVLMLREGWDVRNVKVIVPLRPCGSRTLTEQVLGRGLRKMHAPRIEEDGSVELIPEELYVMEHPSFATVLDEIRDLVDQKDADEIEHDPEYVPIPPQPDPELRAATDVRLVRYLGQRTEAPDWRSRVSRESIPPLVPKLAWLDSVSDIEVETRLHEAFTSDEERGLAFSISNEPSYRDFEAVLEHAYVTPLLRELQSGFRHRTAVKGVVREFLERSTFALPGGVRPSFDAEQDLQATKTALANLCRSEVIARVREHLLPILRDAMTSTEPRVIVQLGETHAQELPGYSALKRFVVDELVRSPFERQAMGNLLEESVARLLDAGTDVTGWIYNHRKGVGYSIEYIWRDLQVPYFPDFIARAKWGEVFHNFIIESKGRFDDRDRAKVAAALSHCETLTQHDKEPWHYLFLLENEPFGRTDISELNDGSPFSLRHALEAQDARGLLPGSTMLQQSIAPAIEASVEPAEEYRSALPAYDLTPQAGAFGPTAQVAPRGWIRVRSARRLDRSMFAARVSGQSMEPGIPDGSWCLFRGFPGGNAPAAKQLDGRRVVVQLLRGGEGPEAGAFTLKRLHVAALDDEGNAKEIDLLPDNPKSAPIRIDPRSGEVTVVAELLELLV